MNDEPGQQGAPDVGEQPRGFAEEIGVEWIDLDPDGARARIEVSAKHLQPYGIVHGGVHAALAESLTSAATYFAVKEDGKVAIGQSNDTAFLRPVREGTIEATAVARHRGSTTWIWDVEIRDAEDRLCALCRMTIAVRELRD
ncbi:MAG: PaaI family thioesterase [Actinobacteria bacterium]|nr:PaaI family thioesterase [Actinomycetota bacterium]